MVQVPLLLEDGRGVPVDGLAHVHLLEPRFAKQRVALGLAQVLEEAVTSEVRTLLGNLLDPGGDSGVSLLETAVFGRRLGAERIHERDGIVQRVRIRIDRRRGILAEEPTDRGVVDPRPQVVRPRNGLDGRPPNVSGFGNEPPDDRG